MARLRGPADASGHLVLVVDDDLTILSSLAQLLEREGHEVITAQDGAEAVQACREREIHLVLLDYFMGDTTGEQVVRQVRDFDDEVQIVLQTGYASERPARTMLKELEIQGYHDKSEGPEKLLAWVDVALKSYRHTRALRTSRDGLRHILRATPDLHRLQPLEELMQGVLMQIQGLLGLSGSLVATILETRPDEESDTDGDEAHFQLRFGTGRFGDRTWNTLQPTERDLVKLAGTTRRVQTGNSLAVPLMVGERVVGAILADSHDLSVTDTELLELFASQAAVAIENVRLYELATVDGLTRVAARRHWLGRLDDTLRLALRHGHPVSVLFLDVDHFKAFNDTYGHLAGDRVLSTLGTCLISRTRKSDVVGRYGGEEFALLLPFTDLDGATVIGERLRQAVSELVIPWEEHDLSVRISVGVTSLAADSEANTARGDQRIEAIRTALIEAADTALYAAKARGRNRVVVGESLRFEAIEAELAQ